MNNLNIENDKIKNIEVDKCLIYEELLFLSDSSKEIIYIYAKDSTKKNSFEFFKKSTGFSYVKCFKASNNQYVAAFQNNQKKVSINRIDITAKTITKEKDFSNVNSFDVDDNQFIYINNSNFCYKYDYINNSWIDQKNKYTSGIDNQTEVFLDQSNTIFYDKKNGNFSLGTLTISLTESDKSGNNLFITDKSNNAALFYEYDASKNEFLQKQEIKQVSNFIDLSSDIGHVYINQSPIDRLKLGDYYGYIIKKNNTINYCFFDDDYNKFSRIDNFNWIKNDTVDDFKQIVYLDKVEKIIPKTKQASYFYHAASGGFISDFNFNKEFSGVAGSYFGQSCSLNSDGNILAVGASNYNAGQGCCEVYEFKNNVWHLVGSRILGVYSSSFGLSCSLNSNGNILAVGAQDYNNNQGYCEIYEFKNNSWIALGSKILGENNSRFGHSCSLNSTGNILAIGAQDYNSNQGYCEVYEYKNNAWNILSSRILGDTGSSFGNSCSLNASGNILAVGASNYNSSQGYCEVYEFKNNAWNSVSSRILGDTGSQFGYACSINSSGNILAIKANNYFEVYEYKNNSWILLGARISVFKNTDYYAKDISLNAAGNILAVGAYEYNSNQGYCEVYEFKNNSWNLIQQKLLGSTSSEFGYSCSLSSDGGVLAVGEVNASKEIIYKRDKKISGLFFGIAFNDNTNKCFITSKYNNKKLYLQTVLSGKTNAIELNSNFNDEDFYSFLHGLDNSIDSENNIELHVNNKFYFAGDYVYFKYKNKAGELKQFRFSIKVSEKAELRTSTTDESNFSAWSDIKGTRKDINLIPLKNTAFTDSSFGDDISYFNDFIIVSNLKQELCVLLKKENNIYIKYSLIFKPHKNDTNFGKKVKLTQDFILILGDSYAYVFSMKDFKLIFQESYVKNATMNNKFLFCQNAGIGVIKPYNLIQEAGESDIQTNMNIDCLSANEDKLLVTSSVDKKALTYDATTSTFAKDLDIDLTAGYGTKCKYNDYFCVINETSKEFNVYKKDGTLEKNITYPFNDIRNFNIDVTGDLFILTDQEYYQYRKSNNYIRETLLEDIDHIYKEISKDTLLEDTEKVSRRKNNFLATSSSKNKALIYDMKTKDIQEIKSDNNFGKACSIAENILAISKDDHVLIFKYDIKTKKWVNICNAFIEKSDFGGDVSVYDNYCIVTAKDKKFVKAFDADDLPLLKQDRLLTEYKVKDDKKR